MELLELEIAGLKGKIKGCEEASKEYSEKLNGESNQDFIQVYEGLRLRVEAKLEAYKDVLNDLETALAEAKK